MDETKNDTIDTAYLPGIRFECPDVYLEPSNTPAAVEYFDEHTIRFVAGESQYAIIGAGRDWLAAMAKMISEYVAGTGPNPEAAIRDLRAADGEPTAGASPPPVRRGVSAAGK